jgi:hypothetical protein
MFEEQLKAYAENMRTLLVVTSCNTVNVEVQSAVMQMRDIIQTAKDAQNAAVVIVADRTREMANLQQKIDGIRLSQEAASIYPTGVFKSYLAVADLQPDGDIWDVIRTAAASETAVAAWEEAVTSFTWRAELLPEVCIGNNWELRHSNIMNIEDDMLLSDVEIYALLATAAASSRISNGQKIIVLSSQTVRNACNRIRSSSNQSNSNQSSSNQSSSNQSSSQRRNSSSLFSPSVTAQISEADSVLFAVNTDTYGKGIHWVLCVLKPEQSKILLFDSMESVTAFEHLQSIREVVQQMYQREFVLEEVALNQQLDALSCGYHVVVNGVCSMHYNNIKCYSDDKARELVKVLAKLMVGYWVVNKKPECVNMFEQLVENLMVTAKQQLQSKLPSPIVNELDDEADVLLDSESKMESLFGWMINQIKSDQQQTNQQQYQYQQQQDVLTPPIAIPELRINTRRS